MDREVWSRTSPGETFRNDKEMIKAWNFSGLGLLTLPRVGECEVWKANRSFSHVSRFQEKSARLSLCSTLLLLPRGQLSFNGEESISVTPFFTVIPKVLWFSCSMVVSHILTSSTARIRLLDMKNSMFLGFRSLKESDFGEKPQGMGCRWTVVVAAVPKPQQVLLFLLRCPSL